jgi:hypothetical protein
VIAPAWIECVLRAVALALVSVFAVATVFVAAVVPYRSWDSLAFGSWSRSIAETGDLWAAAGQLNATRPLFYVPQGLVWRWISEDEWLGRLLSAGFAALLVACVWVLAGQLARDRAERSFLAPLAVGALLSSSVLAAFAAAGMTDVPVAAASAATAAALWSSLPPRLAAPAAAIGAAATVLAKPSGLLALVGVLLATLALHGRAKALPVAGSIVGALGAVAYDAWQASRLDASLASLLRAGNDDFWLARGDAARWDAIAGAGWLGEGARLLGVFALVHGVMRAAGLSTRIALAVAGATAVLWSLAGPLLVDGELGYPFDAGVPGIAAWLGLATAIILAALVARDDVLPRRVYVALLLWATPIGAAWAWQRPDEARLLAPAWPALALLAGGALASVSIALLRVRPAVSLLPMTALALAVLANVVSVDGLGRDGWRSLLELGPSGWRDRAAMENFAYGPFSYHLDLARENVGPHDRIVSSDGRLQYFFPGQVEVEYARTCSEVRGARFFSFLSSGESLELAQLGQQPTVPLAWMQCQSPRLELVGEQPGIYAAFVVDAMPARAPTAEDCHVTAAPGELADAVLGEYGPYEQVSALARRALEVGFQGTRVERTGCSTFRAVVTGVPDDPAVQADFRRQARRVGIDVSYERAYRFPEVSPAIPPVSP